MTSNEVLSMYENIAGLTSSMAMAAQARDWDGLARLEKRCVIEGSAVSTGVPVLEGAQRLRKVDLIKQIMANDRAVRKVTDSWMSQLDRVMHTH
jgi:flagellar protein FliT